MTNPQTMILALTAIALLCSQGCCPGCYPVLPPEQRRKSYLEDTRREAEVAQPLLVAWLKDPALSTTDDKFARNPKSGRLDHIPGTGRYKLDRESKGDGTVEAKYWGFCASPPSANDDPIWNIMFKLQARFTSGQVELVFKDVYYQWPTLGDNPSALTHGHKRAPRTPADMASIEINCLDPLKDQLRNVVATRP